MRAGFEMAGVAIILMCGFWLIAHLLLRIVKALEVMAEVSRASFLIAKEAREKLWKERHDG